MQLNMSRETLRRVREFIAEGLARGDIETGQKLPAERELAARLGTTRAAIRQALSVLEVEEKVIRHVGRGTFVAKVAVGGNGSGSEDRSDDVSPAELMQARLLLEPLLAEAVVLNADAADIQMLRSIVEAQARMDSADLFEESDIAFHRALAEATHNRLLLKVARLILSSRRTHDWRKLKAAVAKRRSNRRAEAIEEHRLIVEALSERNLVEASNAMRRHLEEVRRNVLGT